MGLLYPKPLPPPPGPMMETGWCEINCSDDHLQKLQNNEKKKHLRKLQIRNPAVDHLRIFVVGPIAAGKSSFIQSVHSIFLDRIINTSGSVSAGGLTFTKRYTTNTFKDERGRNLPFVISDAPGLESGRDCGIRSSDIIKALEGHIKEGYKFNPVASCSEQECNSSPTLNDKVHCLVFVIPINYFTVSGCGDHVKKMQSIREKASDLGIPQVVILTHVDEACPHVKEDIKNLYRSQTIYQKVQACHNELGVPMNCIFPVKNYHEERQLNLYMDAVLLFTLTHIMNSAKDFVENIKEPEDEDDRMRSMEPFYSL